MRLDGYILACLLDMKLIHFFKQRKNIWKNVRVLEPKSLCKIYTTFTDNFISNHIWPFLIALTTKSTFYNCNIDSGKRKVQYC